MAMRLSRPTRPLPQAHCSPSLSLQPCRWHPTPGSPPRTLTLVASSSSSSSSDNAPEPQWYDDLRRGSIAGPSDTNLIGAGMPAEGPEGSLAEALLGTKGYAQMEAADRAEAQRIWDAMRASAWERHQKGEMPAWFDPDWIMQEESPINRMLRLEREAGQDTAAGGGGGKGPGGGGGGGGFWREEDPYWPLRDWGEHPMRWWTFAFAAALALGGVWSHAAHGGGGGGLLLGSCSAAALSMCGMAMSDMTDWGHGPVAVKAAWAVCALLACKDFFLGARGAPSSDVAAAQPRRLSGGGVACVAMCAMYMWTGMAELDEWALPANPGSVYKNSDVAYKHMVVRQWGYGNAPLRT